MELTKATISDLLGGSKEGWRTNGNGRRIRSRLCPVRLVQHFRKIGAAYHQLRTSSQGVLNVDREDLLPVLWLALAERGWEIDRQDAIDAWFLASFTPLRSR